MGFPQPFTGAAIGELRPHFILDQPSCTAQFPQAVEVPEQRHVRIGGVRRVGLPLYVGRLPRGKERQVSSQHDDLGTAPLSRNADVQAGVALLCRVRFGEERIATVRTRWREDVDVPMVEQRPNLAFRPAHSGGRSHDLWTDLLAVEFNRTEFVQRGLVQTDHRAQRTRDQVQFVLDHQVRRQQPVGRQRVSLCGIAGTVESIVVAAIDSTEECADFARPRHGGELVHRGDHEARQPAIDRLVDSQNRQ